MCPTEAPALQATSFSSDLLAHCLDTYAEYAVGPPPLSATTGKNLALCNQESESNDMGKYLFAWILGVPAVVLVIVYLLF